MVAIVVFAFGARGRAKPPNPLDVQAARACVTYGRVVQDVTSNSAKAQADDVTLHDQTGGLLKGNPQTQTGQSAPKWAALGNDIITAVADFDPTTPPDKVKLDGDTVLKECASIPAAAKKQAGYQGKLA